MRYAPLNRHVAKNTSPKKNLPIPEQVCFDLDRSFIRGPKLYASLRTQTNLAVHFKVNCAPQYPPSASK
jgi:hypothetical protein